MSNPGYIKLVNDERSKVCFVCEQPYEVRFIVFASPNPGDVMYLRICTSCLYELAEKHETLAVVDSPQPRNLP